MQNKAAMRLPDALVVRYFRQNELSAVKAVKSLKDGRLKVELKTETEERADVWRDLGGHLGLVPDVE